MSAVGILQAIVLYLAIVPLAAVLIIASFVVVWRAGLRWCYGFLLWIPFVNTLFLLRLVFGRWPLEAYVTRLGQMLLANDHDLPAPPRRLKMLDPDGKPFVLDKTGQRL